MPIDVLGKPLQTPKVCPEIFHVHDERGLLAIEATQVVLMWCIA